MGLPSPEPGLVIHYEYLWRNEYQRGVEQGRKQRPCAVVVAVATRTGQTRTIVAPITHTPPRLFRQLQQLILAVNATAKATPRTE